MNNEKNALSPENNHAKPLFIAGKLTRGLVIGVLLFASIAALLLTSSDATIFSYQRF